MGVKSQVAKFKIGDKGKWPVDTLLEYATECEVAEGSTSIDTMRVGDSGVANITGEAIRIERVS